MRGYCVYELRSKGETIRGTARELAFKLKLSEVENLYNACKKGHYIKGYEVVKTADVTYQENEEAHSLYIERTRALQKKCVKTVQKKTKADNLEHLVRELIHRKQPNCYCSFDPFPYLPDLYDMGLDCTAREWVSLPERYNLTKQHRSRKPKHEGYIVEVKKRWTIAH